MCAVSYVGDYWQGQLPGKPYYPAIQPQIWPAGGIGVLDIAPPTRAEMDQLKKDVEELKKLLQAAKAYDEAVGEPDCEQDDKVALIKKVAELVGVSMDEVFGK